VMGEPALPRIRYRLDPRGLAELRRLTSEL
jgi:hypothetical protein